MKYHLPTPSELFYKLYTTYPRLGVDASFFDELVLVNIIVRGVLALLPILALSFFRSLTFKFHEIMCFSVNHI